MLISVKPSYQMSTNWNIMRVASFALLSDIIKDTTFLKTFLHWPLVLLIGILLKCNERRALVEWH